MALLPYVLDPWVNDHDPYYGVRLFDETPSLLSPSLKGLDTPLRSGYWRLLRHLDPEDSGVSAIENTKEEFKVALDVKQFKPEEIKVKVADNCVVVEGKHEERQDEHGYVSRQFTRKYQLPRDVKMEAINSTLSSDGILNILAPKKVDAVKGKEREIKVVQSNQPSIKNKKSKM